VKPVTLNSRKAATDNNNYCYIPRLSLNKTSTVIGWFLFTCLWSIPDWDTIPQLMPAPDTTFVCLWVLLWLLKGKSKYITVHLMSGPSGNKLVLFSLESWCFPWLCLGKHVSELSGKENQPFPLGPYIKCILLIYNGGYFLNSCLLCIYYNTFFRTILSAIHFNYNLQREAQVDDQGNPKLKVTYAKFKEGEATVREVKVEQNYGN